MPVRPAPIGIAPHSTAKQPVPLPSPANGDDALKPRTTALSVALALVPVLALTLGIPFANRVEPRVAGMPFLMAYIASWIVLTPAFMFAVYRSERRP